MRAMRISVELVLAGVLVAVGAWFWPANLGGRTTYVSTHGTSMIPHLHAGDLVILQPASEYHVGDIAAYHSTTLRTVVLHRIVATDDGRFTFKGDNNNFTDPDHPTVDQLVGRLMVRVPHGGEIRGFVARPEVLFPALVCVFGGCFVATRRSRRTRKRSTRPDAAAAPRPPTWPRGQRGIAVVVVGALSATGAVWAAVTVWRMPRTEPVAVAQPYRQTATISYSGNGPAGAVYPDGQLRTGDPVFTRLVNRLTIDLRYTCAMTPTVRRTLRETSRVVADLSSDTGWHRELALAEPRTFAGDQLQATATLDLRALLRIEQAFTAETGLAMPDVTLQIAWRLHVDGDAGATPITADLVPTFAFQVTPVELLPTPSPSVAGQGATGLSVSKTGSVPVRAVTDRTFNLWRVHLSDPLTRSLSIVLVAAILAITAAFIVLDGRRASRGAAAAIIAQYRYLLVNADEIPLAGRRPVVAVAKMRDLARLAKLHEEFIVHAETGARHRFAVFTDAVVYVHDVAGVARTVSSDATLAQWALAGLEACAAERRRVAHPSLHRPTRPFVTQHSDSTRVDGTVAPS